MFRLEQDGAAARLVLDRPSARNAIPADGWKRLADRCDEVGRSDARLLIVTGAGDAFCAGADLSDFPALRADEAARVHFREAMRVALDRLAGLAVPSVAVVEGPCYGAGVALAMACDLRIAGPGARFAITPSRLGISYPQEDVHRLVELVGPGWASRLLLGGEAIDGAEAARIGLAEWHEPEGGVETVVAALLSNAGESLVALKRAIRLAAGGVCSDAGQDRRFDALFGGPALAERLEAARRK